ncbi:MAG: AGE family epimerase/isomerase [Helicobacteraceae bacterium]|jgi:hypothetical protein|nr:AGE family epimerase/isomerase [Helicobacteraceae bacterium]
MKKFALISCAAIALVGDPDQTSLCVVDTWNRDAVAEACKEGQKVAFLPGYRGGNENGQLSAQFAAINCDHRYVIALTNGGVSCIYKPIKPKPAKSE